MTPYWEANVLAYLLGSILLWWVVRWLLITLGMPRPYRQPIYGPADPYRRDGRQPRPNLRVVRP